MRYQEFLVLFSWSSPNDKWKWIEGLSIAQNNPTEDYNYLDILFSLKNLQILFFLS